MVIDQWAAARQEKGLWSMTALDLLHWPKCVKIIVKNWLYCAVTGDTDQSTPDVVLCPLIWKTPTKSRICFHFPGLHWHKLPWVPAAQHLLQQQLCAVLLPRRVSASSAGWMVPAGLKGNTMAPQCVQFFLICFSLCKISGICLMPSYI